MWSRRRLPRLAPAADDGVRLLAAGGDFGEGDVRQLVEQPLERPLGGRELLLEPPDLLAELARPEHEVVRPLAGPLAPRDLLTRRVPCRLPLLRRLDQLPSLQ